MTTRLQNLEDEYRDYLIESGDQLFPTAGVTPLIADLPPNVEVTLREADDRKLLFVLNTDAEPVTVPSVPRRHRPSDRKRRGRSSPARGLWLRRRQIGLMCQTASPSPALFGRRAHWAHLACHTHRRIVMLDGDRWPI